MIMATNRVTLRYSKQTRCKANIIFPWHASSLATEPHDPPRTDTHQCFRINIFVSQYLFVLCIRIYLFWHFTGASNAERAKNETWWKLKQTMEKFVDKSRVGSFRVVERWLTGNLAICFRKKEGMVSGCTYWFKARSTSELCPCWWSCPRRSLCTIPISFIQAFALEPGPPMPPLFHIVILSAFYWFPLPRSRTLFTSRENCHHR